ncbi:hypothetical protein K504DRAFT_465244 [Pleomassaria siparia CBS 279.74]|uniref:Homeobox domain-containing protein n=1 Tax=Pleomassaria siparia CBS 279.74 TaxID=1314801 RepID=A0A6G1KG21_9PLEO|nr:hypothetical protein K504DRAFT_465244 [Pleomassaria siparia CBS 279.74]
MAEHFAMDDSHHDELAFFTPAALNAGHGDCTTTRGFHDRSWVNNMNGRSLIEVPADADSVLPATNGELLHCDMHSDFMSTTFAESNISSFIPNDLALNSADFSMDTVWPVLPEPIYMADYWANSLFDDQSNFQVTAAALYSSDPNNTTASQSTSPEEKSQKSGRKKRRQISPGAKRLLEDCFEGHKSDPYISQQKMEMLASQTNLSLRQVRTFFANARARKLPRMRIPTKPDQKQIAGNENVPASSSLHPMERFLSSSPEDEGISEEAVRTAAISQAGSHHFPPKDSRASDTISVSSTVFSTSNSESGSSQASVDSATSRGPRRGRKRQREPTRTVNQRIVRPSDLAKRYQCTFCTSDFAQKFDWRRHEESVHFPQTQWTCMPDGPIYTSEDGPRCVFCEELNPDSEHLETHNYNGCLTTSLSDRIFLRKDKLRQHLTQVHRCRQFPKKFLDWCQPIKRNVTPTCGLCGMILADWATRVDHISSHFSNGVGMDLWILDNYPGGIIAHSPSGSDETIRAMCELIVVPDGDFHCELCADCFKTLPHLIFHNRQVHEVYNMEHRMLMHVVTNSGSEATTSRKELSDMAQKSFGMKLFQQGNPAHRTSVWQTKRPVTPLVKKQIIQLDDSGSLPRTTARPNLTGVSSLDYVSAIDPQHWNQTLDISNHSIDPLHHQPNSDDTTRTGYDIGRSLGQDTRRKIPQLPSGPVDQDDPTRSADVWQQPISAYLRKATSTQSSARQPRKSSFLSRHHHETTSLEALEIDMTKDTMLAPSDFHSAEEFPSVAAYQTTSWMHQLHANQCQLVPTNRDPSSCHQTRLHTRLSGIPTQSPSPSTDGTWTPFHQSRRGSVGVADCFVDSMTQAFSGGANTAQSQCWNGQTRTRNL